MISFPAVPAGPAPLAGAGAAPAATDNSNASDAAEFIDFLKALTAPGQACSPLPAVDPAPVLSVPIGLRPAPASAQAQQQAPDEAPRTERKDAIDVQDVDPSAMLPIVAPVVVAPPPPLPNALPQADVLSPASAQTPALSDGKLIVALANKPARLPSGSQAASTNAATPAAPAEQPPAAEVSPAPDVKAHAPAASATHATLSAPVDARAQAPVEKTSDNAAVDAAPVTTNAPVAAAQKAAPNSQAPDAATAPVATASAPVQNSTADAGASKRDSNSNASDRRNLDAVAPRATSAAAPSTAPVFQMTADIRSLLSPGSGVAPLSSSLSAMGGTPGVRDGADIPQQIVSAMRMQWNNGVGDARIRLTPEYLGDVTISIRVERGEVTAMLQASAPETRQWIESHEPMLRQMLSDRGLHLDEFVVSEDRHASSSEEGGGENRETRERQQPARRRAVQGATFEVVA